MPKAETKNPKSKKVYLSQWSKNKKAILKTAY